MNGKSIRSGFTLIELLVVIAIIAILAALLFPVYTNAKQSGATAKCISHERQLYNSLMLYVDDYNGRLPRVGFLNYSSNNSLFWPYVKNKDITKCQKKGAYGYNRMLCGPCSANKAWVPGTISSRINVLNNDGFVGRPFAEVVNPRRTMVFICAKPTEDDLTELKEPYGWEWEPHDCGDEFAKKRMVNIHNDGTTYAFLDGHAQCLKPTGTRYGFRVATDGIDYDGNGTFGTTDYMQ